MYKDYYQILEVDKSATFQQIQDAYQRALAIIGQMEATQLSEGKFAHLDLQASLNDVTEAHKVLSNIYTRQIFDETMYVPPVKELIYYLQKEQKKLGPLTLEQLKNETIIEDDLVWRSDSDTWRKAKEFIELKASLSPTPPLLPEERKLREGKATFFSKVYPCLIKYFIISTLIVAGLSSLISIYSWDNYPAKNLNLAVYHGSTPVKLTERYLHPEWGFDAFRDNEEFYAQRESFIIRPFYAFFSTLHLDEDEQKNYLLLVFKLLFSSVVLFLLVFLVVGVIIYYRLTT